MKGVNMTGHGAGALALCLLMLCAAVSGCAGRHAGDAGMSGGYGSVCSGMGLTKSELAVLDGQKGEIARAVPASGRSAVAAEYAMFLRGQRKNVSVVSRRSEKFLGYAREVFRSRGMPEELAYLAIVESGFNPVARSRSGAAGAWQFIPSTGRVYGLSQDRYLDERLDVYESTEAAASYLQALYRRFGDWPTAIAAYNAGEGKMSRALDAAGRRTFFGVLERNHTLSDDLRLKEETCRYVPRFLATVAIMENLDRLGFAPIDNSMMAQETRFQVAPATDLRAMARSCDMPWQEFRAINPHHLSTVSSTRQPSYAYVPNRAQLQALAFVSNPVIANDRAIADARRHAPAARGCPGQAKAGHYRMQYGDTLYAVARRHNTSVGAIMAANKISDPSQVRVGTTLSIPSAGSAGAAAGMAAKGGRASYRVQANDSLWGISRKTGVSVAELKRLNNLGDGHIHAGQQLVIQ